MNSSDLIPTVYRLKEEADKLIGVDFHRMTSPFYDGVKWAVRKGGLVLGVKGDIILEPIPSMRDQEFYKLYRFDTLDEAVKAYEIYLSSIDKT